MQYLTAVGYVWAEH